MNYPLTFEGDFKGSEPSVVRVGEKGYRRKEGTREIKKAGSGMKRGWGAGSGERGAGSGVLKVA